MPFTETFIPDLLLFEPKLFEDERGYFFEAFNERTFAEAGIATHFLQDNQARSSYGVIRGLHYQVEPYAQAKLVRVLEGAVWDVAVDLREGSATYGQWFGVELSAANKRQLYIPGGFAHGYAVLSEWAEFFYKCDNYYSKAHEGGVHWQDAQLAIDWKIPAAEAVISEKDRYLPAFGAHRK